MNKRLLFTDGSVHVQSKVGYGTFLLISEEELLNKNLNTKLRTKRFENTSSTKLEMETLLWALSELEDICAYYIVYSDSQNIIQLVDRRKRLEENQFRSKKGELLKQHELYKAFYALVDKLDCEFIKIKGHQPSSNKNELERVFTLVDKASRKALRDNT